MSDALGESRFWDKRADKYAAQPVADEAAYQTKLAATRALLRVDMDVLEFGCGTGSTAIAHAPYVRHIDAVDFSARMLTIAQAKADKAGVGNISFARNTIEDLDVADASYDVVMGHSILHLLKDKDAVIAKVMRILKPGGAFVSSTTCLGDTLKAFKFLAPIGKGLGLLPQLDVMTRADLLTAMRTAGFSIEQDWQPQPGKAVFIIARKPEGA